MSMARVYVRSGIGQPHIAAACCRSRPSVRDVATVMGDLQVRRLPVLDRHKRLVGIVSLGDLALTKPASAGDALQAIAEAPAGTLA